MRIDRAFSPPPFVYSGPGPLAQAGISRACGAQYMVFHEVEDGRESD